MQQLIQSKNLSDIDDLHHYMYGDRAECQWLVSDLVLGAWKSHQFANEINAQLDSVNQIDTEALVANKNISPVSVNYASAIAAGIDSEASGVKAVALANALANAIFFNSKNRYIRGIVIFAPREDAFWGEENTQVIEILQQRFLKSNLQLVLIYSYGVSEDTPEAWYLPENKALQTLPDTAGQDIILLTPGLIDSNFYKTIDARYLELTDTIELDTSLLLINPTKRPKYADFSKLGFDQCSLIFQEFKWLSSYWQYHGNTRFIDPDEFTIASWAAFSQGSPDLALRLLNKAYSSAQDDLEKSVLLCNIQGMRIASLKFSQAGGIKSHKQLNIPEIDQFLYMSKGWGLTLSGDFKEGGIELEKAKSISIADEADLQYLYLNNIYALNCFRQGDTTKAMALEKSIEDIMQEQKIYDQQLSYVNCINQARLYNSLHDYENAIVYYKRAFSTAESLYSESDLIFRCVCLAGLYEKSGAKEKALACWIQAAMYWLSSTFQEGLSRRAVSSIVKGNAFLNWKVVYKIPEVIAEKITQLMDMPEPLPLQDSAYSFFRLNEDIQNSCSCENINIVGTEGLYFYCTDVIVNSQMQNACLNLTLANVLSKSLDILHPVLKEWHVKTILIDTCDGKGLPETLQRVFPRAYKWNLSQLNNMSVNEYLDNDILDEKLFCLETCKGVASIQKQDTSLLVNYKRYKSSLILQDLSRDIVTCAQERSSIFNLLDTLGHKASHEEIMQGVWFLEKQRVVNLSTRKAV